jgi:AcrR family transcriptional regulator
MLQDPATMHAQPRARTSESDQEDLTHFRFLDELAFPDWPNTRERGRNSRRKILRTAITIIAENGFHALTMRKLAAESGMLFGSLTHHYPTQDGLLSELLETIFRTFGQQIESVSHNVQLPPSARLVELCRVAFVGVQDRLTIRIFLQLWSLANFDPLVRAKLDELYNLAIGQMTVIVSAMRPDLPPLQTAHAGAVCEFCDRRHDAAGRL